MQDHYKTLGVNSSASPDEIRRAYRILARRYHPDLNPGTASEERFKAISLAYNELSDTKRRQAYDIEYEANQISRFSKKLNDYQKNQEYTGRRQFTDKKNNSNNSSKDSVHSSNRYKTDGGLFNSLDSSFRVLTNTWNNLKRFFPWQKATANIKDGVKLSIIEVSVSIQDAIKGVKKTIEIQEPDGSRKLSVEIPAGVRNGSVIRLKERRAKNTPEELVLIIRLANHPLISVQTKGLVIELPISIREALEGANITVPTLDEPAIIKIPEGSQSGSEIRLKNRGIKLKDGSQGDIIYRLIVKVPTSYNAVGIKEQSAQFDQYYEEPLRKALPNSLMDL